MKILVTGACGYKGTVLVPKLLERGHRVIALDSQWFGNFLPAHANLSVIRGDIRESTAIDLDGVDVIIHLAGIANDPCGDLDPKLTWETNCLATMQLADRAARAGVRRFIFASSGSVYGVSSEPKVTEDLPLFPLSEYNKTKMCAERILLSYAGTLGVQIVRPGTVCGYSPRMRLDVSVNMLTMQALARGRISVFGGEQIRPHVHIDDITDTYIFLLDHPEHIGVYNAGFENISIGDLARLVAERVHAELVVTDARDPRSYRMNSDKLLAAGFRPRKGVADAVQELIGLHRRGALKDEERSYNVRWMQRERIG